VEANPFQRLNRSIFADSSGDALDQFSSVGLGPAGLTLFLLGIH
jgi:hypothetical protein